MLHLPQRIPLVILLITATTGLLAQSSPNSRSVVIGVKESKPNAILYLNPENKDQGFMLPQLSSAQRIAIPTTSPNDDGLMVFDKDLNAIFLWKNNAWANTSTEGSMDNSATNEIITGVQLISNELRITEAGKTSAQSLNTVQLTGDASGVVNKTVVNSIQGNPVNNAKLSAADLGKLLTWNGTQWIAQGAIDNSITNETITSVQLVANDLRITEAGATTTQNLSSLSIAGDVTGPLSNANVARIQGNAIAATKLTSTDNGKLMVWNGTQWVATTFSTLSALQYYTIDPSAFTVLKPDGKADKHNMVIFESDDAFTTIHSRAEGGTVIAPVNLPHGATIMNITLHYMDREAGNIEFHVYRKALGASNEELLNWTSTGSSTLVRNAAFNSFNGRQLIDNNAYTYRVEVKLNPTNTADKPSDATHRVYGIKIQYQP